MESEMAFQDGQHVDLNASALDSETITQETQGYNRNSKSREIMESVENLCPLPEFLEHAKKFLPVHDITIVVGMLTRPNGFIELTTFKVCQTLFVWRRAALAMMKSLYDPPGSGYPRIHEIIDKHNALGRKLGSNSIECISPIQAISDGIEWLITIKGTFILFFPFRYSFLYSFLLLLLLLFLFPSFSPLLSLFFPFLPFPSLAFPTKAPP